MDSLVRTRDSTGHTLWPRYWPTRCHTGHTLEGRKISKAEHAPMAHRERTGGALVSAQG